MPGVYPVMPIYEYQCEKCRSIFEEWQSGFDDHEQACPDCGGQSRRLISHSSFHLKGGGWFADGYGGKDSGSQSAKATQSDGPAKSADAAGAGSSPKSGTVGGDSASAPKGASDVSSASSAS